MSDPGPDGPSFDPRRWSAAKADASKASGADPTFDPKSWSKPKRASPTRQSSSAAPILAGGACLAVIGVAIAFVFWPRPAPPHAAKVVAIRTVQAPVVPGAQRRALTLVG